MKLKICGMKYPDNIRQVAKLKPDFMGFIFYSKSKRFVGENFQLPEITSEIKKVGVFVNDNLHHILEKVNRYQLNLVQLHGNETATFCAQVREHTKVIKAFGVDDTFHFSALQDYENACDYFLFDTKTTEYGGSGKCFDKSNLRKYSSANPFFISGGMDLEALSTLPSPLSNLFAVDVNSRFETAPALKNVDQLKKLKHELSSK